MNCRLLVTLSGLVAVAGAALVPGSGADVAPLALMAVASAAEGKAGKSGGSPPLVVDKDAPLLLAEPTEAEKSAATKPARDIADNGPCFVCHLNYKEEPLAHQHAVRNVGCVKCHGKSYAHRNDENNITPPEIMVPPEKIDRACGKCHQTHDVPAVKVIACWLKRCGAKTDPKQIVCTDCHGRHRLKVRTVRWDKKTGKLIGHKRDRPTNP